LVINAHGMWASDPDNASSTATGYGNVLENDGTIRTQGSNSGACSRVRQSPGRPPSKTPLSKRRPRIMAVQQNCQMANPR